MNGPVTDYLLATNFVVAPDGGWLVYDDREDEDAPPTLFAVDLDAPDATREVLAQGAAGDIFTGLTFTTDARSLVYNLVTRAPETSSLFKIDLTEDGPSAPVMLSLPDQYVVLFDPLP